ncbi:MAG: SdiA-regulated domain-containing protein [Polyangiaceae bacterium]
MTDTTGPGLREFSGTGKLLRTITLSGFTELASIVWLGAAAGSGAGDQFALAEETVTTGGVARGDVVVVKIPDSGSVTITKGSGANWVQTVNPQWSAVSSGLGLEALGYHAGSNAFYAATEKAEVDGDWKIYTFANTSGNQSVTAIADLSGLLSGVATDVSDLKVITSGSQLHFLLLSHEGSTGSTGPGKLINCGYNLIEGGSSSTFQIYSTLTLPAFLVQAEGADVTPTGKTVFITGQKGASNGADLLILQAP